MDVVGGVSLVQSVRVLSAVIKHHTISGHMCEVKKAVSKESLGKPQ